MKAVLLFCAVLVGSSAFADDLDVDGARRAYENQKAIADQALSSYRSAESEFQRGEGAYLSELSREKQYSERVDDVQRDIRSTETSISRLQNEIPKAEGAIRDLEREKASLEAALPEHRRARDREHVELRPLEAEFQKAEAALKAEKAKEKPDEAQVKRLQADLDQARKLLNAQKAEIARAEAVYKNTQDRLRDNASAISNTQTDLAQKKNRLAQQQRQLQDRHRDLRSAREDLRQQKDTVRVAQSRMEDARFQMNAAKTEYDRQALLAQQAYAYYETVQGNYTRERNRVIAAANAAGSQDGDREGAERATADGESAGAADASRVGEETGTREAKARETRSGYRTGRADTSRNPTAYQTGTAEGRALAERKAVSEEKPRGYNDALALTLAGQPQNQATQELAETDSPTDAGADGGAWLSASELVVTKVAAPEFPIPADPTYRIPSAPSVTARVPAVDWRYFDPACTGLALSEFEPLCRDSYQSGYQNAYGASYKKAFVSAHKAGFGAGIQAAYDTALTQKFPDDFTLGLENGVREQGLLDGYSTRLMTAQKEAYASGTAAWSAYLSTGHLIRVRESALAETNGDGLFTPGEKVTLVTTIDNYGAKPAPAASLRMVLNKSEKVQVAVGDRPLPEFAPQTRTVVKGAMHASILAARAGAAVGLAAQAKRQETVVADVDAKAVAHFPVEAEALTLSKVPKVDEKVAGVLRWRNLLDHNSRATPVKATTAPAVVKFEGSLEIPELEPGGVFDLPVQVTPGVWVSKAAEVPVLLETQDQTGGAAVTTQIFPQFIDIDRAGSLLLYDMAGKPVVDSTFAVKAGTKLAFQVLFQFHRTRTEPGPFAIAAGGTSDPAIKASNNSTVGTTYGSASPGTRYTPVAMSYDIPAAMKGKSGYILVGLLENNRYIHVLQVQLKIE